MSLFISHHFLSATHIAIPLECKMHISKAGIPGSRRQYVLMRIPITVII